MKDNGGRALAPRSTVSDLPWEKPLRAIFDQDSSHSELRPDP